MEYQLTKNKNPLVAAKFKRIDKQINDLLDQSLATRPKNQLRRRYIPPMPIFPTIETKGLRFNK